MGYETNYGKQQRSDVFFFFKLLFDEKQLVCKNTDMVNPDGNKIMVASENRK